MAAIATTGQRGSHGTLDIRFCAGTMRQQRRSPDGFRAIRVGPAGCDPRRIVFATHPDQRSARPPSWLAERGRHRQRTIAASVSPARPAARFASARLRSPRSSARRAAAGPPARTRRRRIERAIIEGGAHALEEFGSLQAAMKRGGVTRALPTTVPAYATNSGSTSSSPVVKSRLPTRPA